MRSIDDHDAFKSCALQAKSSTSRLQQYACSISVFESVYDKSVTVSWCEKLIVMFPILISSSLFTSRPLVRSHCWYCYSCVYVSVLTYHVCSHVSQFQSHFNFGIDSSIMRNDHLINQNLWNQYVGTVSPHSHTYVCTSICEDKFLFSV